MTRSRRVSWLAIVPMLALALALGSPASADTYFAWSEAGIPPQSDLFVWCEDDFANPPVDCDFSTTITCDNPEGGASLLGQANAYIGFGIFKQAGAEVDLSAYSGGDLKFFIKSTRDPKIEFQCFEDGPLVTYTKEGIVSDYGFVANGTWQEISIPICDFTNPGTLASACSTSCLSGVRSPFMSTIDMSFFSAQQVDKVRWEKSNAGTHTGATSVQAQGRQFVVDGEPFVVNAVAYSPLSVGENWTGAWRDRADRYNVDFPLMAASGVNTVRLYAPILSTALLDAAWANGLHVMPTFGVAPAQLGCPEGRQFMIDEFVDVVSEWKDHPAILAWIVGNEVNRSADYPGDAVWYPHLDAMAAAAQTAEGASAHPVGTANADDNLNGICEPGVSDDTALPNVDFWGAQFYRGCSFTNAFTAYAGKSDCNRPMIITEFGADAYDSGLNAEDQATQATCLASLLGEAQQNLGVRGGVLAGQAVFEWADEWWKANPDASNPDNTCVDGATAWNTHDGCTSFVNAGYPDMGINEEWWGVVTNNAADPAARGLRTAATRLGEAYRIGVVCNQAVTSHNQTTGDTSVTFAPAAGSADHTLYYGLLGNVSTYDYLGSAEIGSSGSATVTLPSGSLFWVIAARNGDEGCYGTDSNGTERACFPGAGPGGCAIAQSSSRDCECAAP